MLLVDQWIETGGTMKAAIQLMERLGGTVVGESDHLFRSSTCEMSVFYAVNCLTQESQLWPSRTLKGESGLKQIINSLTASQKSSRGRLTENIWIPLKGSTAEG